VNARATGKSVTLGDVADIFGSDAGEVRQLESIELFSASKGGRYLSAREIQKTLMDRGVDFRRHTLSGASLVELLPAIKPAIVSSRNRNGRASLLQPVENSAERIVNETITRFLKRYVDAKQHWKVKVSLTPKMLQLAKAAQNAVILKIPRQPREGDVEAWLDDQPFRIRWQLFDRTLMMDVLAKVRVLSSIIVAARDLPRGTILDARDIRVQPVNEKDDHPAGFTLSADVLGREITRPVRAEDVLQREMLREPQLVKRGDRVIVYVNSKGVRLRTEGKAREAGARGDVIAIESSYSRKKTFRAVVTGVNEVRVDALSAFSKRKAAPR